jgi:N6-L-threonylcarbamoyladenine synthase
MIPMVVRSHHKDVAPKLFEDALKEAGITEDKLEAIAFSNAPGLAPCLLEGMSFCKELSKKLNTPSKNHKTF